LSVINGKGADKSMPKWARATPVRGKKKIFGRVAMGTYPHRRRLQWVDGVESGSHGNRKENSKKTRLTRIHTSKIPIMPRNKGDITEKLTNFTIKNDTIGGEGEGISLEEFNFLDLGGTGRIHYTVDRNPPQIT